MSDEKGQHVPVLPNEVKTLLKAESGDVVLDCTLGLGGHARMLAESVGSSGMLIGMDVDELNLQEAGERLKNCGCPYRLFRCNFSSFEEVLEEVGITGIDVILADLGVSSTQLDDGDRGFSFQSDGPLDMRLDDRLAESAADLINRLSESELADAIYQYGQERFSRRIARAIHHVRHRGRITTTGQLAEIVAKAMRVKPSSRSSKIHPATRTFQALRIAVNDELGALERLLAKAPRYLRTGGRIGVISFHSLEDGIVKRDFRQQKSDGFYTILTKKPVTGSEEEIAINPRCRSAKLRVAVRTDLPFPG